jgi:hypothetical protein
MARLRLLLTLLLCAAFAPAAAAPGRAAKRTPRSAGSVLPSGHRDGAGCDEM